MTPKLLVIPKSRVSGLGTARFTMLSYLRRNSALVSLSNVAWGQDKLQEDYVIMGASWLKKCLKKRGAFEAQTRY